MSFQAYLDADREEDRQNAAAAGRRGARQGVRPRDEGRRDRGLARRRLRPGPRARDGPGARRQERARHQRHARRQHRHPPRRVRRAPPRRHREPRPARPPDPRGRASGRAPAEVQPGEGERLGEVELALRLPRATGRRPRRRRGRHTHRPPASRAPRRTAGCRARARGARRAPSPTPSARCRCRSRGPSRRTIVQRVGAGGRGVRQVERHVVVGLRHRVPVRQVGLELARARPPPRVHVLDREPDAAARARARRPPRRSRGRTRAASGTAGAARRCRRPSSSASAIERSILSHGSVPQTRWVSSRRRRVHREHRDAVQLATACAARRPRG